MLALILVTEVHVTPESAERSIWYVVIANPLFVGEVQSSSIMLEASGVSVSTGLSGTSPAVDVAVVEASPVPTTLIADTL